VARKSEPGQEVVLFVPLPHDLGQANDGRARVHRYRSLDLRLGRELLAFRTRYGLTQDEVARVVATSSAATISQWEAGRKVPDGLRRERLREPLAGRLWPELRSVLLGSQDFPGSWLEAVRWCRRASRGRGPRESAGAVVAAILDHLRALGSPAALRQCYLERDGEWAYAVADQPGLGSTCRADLRRIEEAAHGLRWLEVVQGQRFDLSRSLVPQLPLALLDADSRDERPDA
jgi:transcriptional regulator with XRE-family HTH domain